MEVRWLLTNRKHGGKTKSVSVLKAALKKRRDGGKKTETTVNDWKRGREREEISKSSRERKNVCSTKEECRQQEVDSSQ